MGTEVSLKELIILQISGKKFGKLIDFGLLKLKANTILISRELFIKFLQEHPINLQRKSLKFYDTTRDMPPKNYGY